MTDMRRFIFLLIMVFTVNPFSGYRTCDLMINHVGEIKPRSFGLSQKSVMSTKKRIYKWI